ncbi:unnamed protein product [Closterium sp. Yama58-4]|nr:unnamed protein product [Closterium sp. Yama58-4]
MGESTLTLGAVAALLTTALVLWLRRRNEQQALVAAPLLPSLPPRASSFISSPQIATAAAETSSAGESNGAFSAIVPTQRAANGALLSVDHGSNATAVANATTAATATADRSAYNADTGDFGGPVAAGNGRAYNGYAALNGASSNGNALNGYASNGAASNGLALNGYALNGAASNGHALNGHAVKRHAVNGHAVNGYAVHSSTGQESFKDYEPFAVRAVQQRPSRKADDLQYHVGVRYTGDAHCMIRLHLEVGGLKWSVPVDVHDLDVDAEVWVKLRLTPKKPFVASLSLAFVRLPTIKLVLAPFHVLNVVGIPPLAILSRPLSLLSDPYCRLLFGGAVVESKRNRQTSHAASPGDPVWNQDFLFCVESPKRQKLTVVVRDSALFQRDLGFVQSKRNRQTSHAASPGDPVWNQDFLFCVESPKRQKLTVVMRDSALFQRDLGFVQVSALVAVRRGREYVLVSGVRDPVWNQDFLFCVESPKRQKLTVVVRVSALFQRDLGFVQVGGSNPS